MEKKILFTTDSKGKRNKRVYSTTISKKTRPDKWEGITNLKTHSVRAKGIKPENPINNQRFFINIIAALVIAESLTQTL